MIDTRALDIAVRRFPSVLRDARDYSPRSAVGERERDDIRLEYRLVLTERAGVVPGMASR